MNGLFSWAKNKIAAIVKPITETFSHVKTLAQSWWENPVATEKTYDFFKQFFAGVSRLISLPTMMKIVKAKKTREALGASIYENIGYISPVLVYEVVFKGLLHNIPYLNYVQDTPIEYGMDFIARAYFMRQIACMFVDNATRNLNVAKAASEEQPASKHFKACGCESTTVIQAGLASPFYHLAKSATVQLAASYFPYGEYITFPLSVLVNGEGLLEYKLANASMCTMHRTEALNKNHPYTLGMGASYSAVAWLMNYLVRSKMGVDSYFVTNAIANVLYQYCIANAYFTDKPLPGKEKSVDVFRYGRVLMERVLSETSNSLIPMLTADSNVNWSEKIENTKSGLNSFPPTRWTLQYFVDEKFFETPNQKLVDKFVMRPSASQFLEFHDKGIYRVLDGIIAKRKEIAEMTFVDQIVSVSPYLPNFILSPNVKAVLPILANKSMDGVLENLREKLTALPRKVITLEAEPVEYKRAVEQVDRTIWPKSLPSSASQGKIVELPDKKETERKEVVSAVVQQPVLPVVMASAPASAATAPAPEPVPEFKKPAEKPRETEQIKIITDHRAQSAPQLKPANVKQPSKKILTADDDDWVDVKINPLDQLLADQKKMTVSQDGMFGRSATRAGNLAGTRSLNSLDPRSAQLFK